MTRVSGGVWLQNRSFDAGLCHGSSGIAYIFGKFSLISQNSEFRDCQKYWINETLKMATHTDGVAGFKSLQTDETGKLRKWRPDYSFLEGVSGIGLSLLSFLDPQEHDWDRILLIS